MFAVKDISAAQAMATKMNIKMHNDAGVKSDTRYGFKRLVLEDLYGQRFSLIEPAVQTSFESWWNAQHKFAVPANVAAVGWQKRMVAQAGRLAIAATNMLGIVGIWGVNEVVPDIASAQLWWNEYAGMKLLQFEKPELIGLGANFNDCAQDPAMDDAKRKRCDDYMRIFPSATLGLFPYPRTWNELAIGDNSPIKASAGGVQMLLNYCERGCAAGYSTSYNELQGTSATSEPTKVTSFVRPAPPYHSAFTGICELVMEVPDVGRR